MPGVRVKEEEPFESVLKRFKKQCEKAGILSEIASASITRKPSVKKKKKTLAQEARLEENEEDEQRMPWD
jgi:small subunit ribosomal protein S21